MNKCSAIMLLVAIMLTPRVRAEGSEKFVLPQLDHFEAVGLNIFVPVVVTNAKGLSTRADFIVDTGTNRTTIDVGVANSLGLKPYATSSNLTPTGSTVRYTALISTMSTLSQSSAGVEVLVDDLALYSNAYKRQVGGLLAMDFLKDYDLLVDFPHSQIGLLQDGTKLSRFGKLLTVKLTSEKGLPLLSITLPTGKTARLIFDTGFDSLADALLFQSQVEDLRLLPPITTGTVQDVNGLQLVRIGTIPWLRIGKGRLKPAIVKVSEQVPPRMFSFAHAGLIGLFPFQKGVVALNFPRHTLMVSAPLRAGLE